MKKLLIAGTVIALFLMGGSLVLSARRSDVPKAAAPPSGSLVALGDSVAAGVGLAPDSDSSACARTDQSYPHLVAAKQNLNLHNLACTGATLPAGIVGNQAVNQLAVAPQLDQLFALPMPTYITLTAGANDVDWTGFITKCYAGVCGTPADTAAAAARLAAMSQNMQSLLKQIGEHYGDDSPPVLVTGYYQVFPTTTAGCSDLSGIDAAELAWGRQQQANLNDAIRTATSLFKFATFTPIDFSGHELCSPDSWVQGLSDKQPYHPTPAGQAAYATQIISAMK